MRTTKAAATDVASGEGERPVYYDALFRDTKDHVVAPPPLTTGARFADTHAHLDMLHHPELALARSAAHGVDLVVTVIDSTEEPTYTLENLDGWLAMAKELLDSESFLLHTGITGSQSPTQPEVRIIVGCHPHNAAKYDAAIEQALLETLKDPRACGIGEIGLDYHYDFSPRDVQQQVFRRQLELAHEHGLLVSLHLREAHDDGLRILREMGAPSAGVLLHCFNLDYATLEPFLELGCHVAYGGPLTFKKSDDVRDAALRTPLERILTETDAPFMAPHPVRGVVCGPEHVIYTAACLAEVFGRAHDEVAAHVHGEVAAKAHDEAATRAHDESAARAHDEAATRALYDQLFRNACNFFVRP